MSYANDHHTISVLVAGADSDVEEKGLFRNHGRPVVKDIPIAQLQAEIAAIRQDLSILVEDSAADEEGALKLSELSVQLEISASGGVHLIGTAEVGATAALTLTFSR